MSADARADAAAATDIVLRPVHVLSRDIAAGRLSPVDLTDALLARIAALAAKLHAFVDVYASEARLAAEAADKAIRSGLRLGPLHGIPIALKDLIDIEGKVTTGGSPTRRGARATTTATIVRRLVGQGMIVLGKTHTVEFAFGGWGTNEHMGTPWNPWDGEVARTPGGSSSGSGVAVAARLAPCAIGTDTGGSVRLPAAFCGITGLKVTIGQISVHGILPLSPSLDTPGPLTRHVSDAAMLFEALHGQDPLDPVTQRGRPVAVMPTLARGVQGLRLARLPAGERTGIAAGVLAAYDRSLDDLAALGARIIDVALPMPLDEYAVLSAVMQAEAYWLRGAIADDPRAEIDEWVRRRILGGASLSARDYLTAIERREEMKRAFDAALGDADALLTPTTHTTAVPVATVNQDELPSRLTRFVNLLDMCAVSVPNGFADGLPTSLQIACRGHHEAMALRIGFAYQQATDWHEREPAMIAC
jgi:aspartyl-tRNA(Asn)/glutamyl-tRNA(Gln) amidotransferase subunit A